MKDAFCVIPDGTYCVTAIPKKKSDPFIFAPTDTKYPDTDAVFPNGNEPLTKLSIVGDVIGTAYTKIVRAMDDTVGLNFKYVTAAFSEGDTFTVEIRDPDTVIYFKDYDRDGLIMPLKVNRG